MKNMLSCVNVTFFNKQLKKISWQIKQSKLTMGIRGRDRMVLGITSACAIGVEHHVGHDLDSLFYRWPSIQLITITVILLEMALKPHLNTI